MIQATTPVAADATIRGRPAIGLGVARLQEFKTLEGPGGEQLDTGRTLPHQDPPLTGELPGRRRRATHPGVAQYCGGPSYISDFEVPLPTLSSASVRRPELRPR